MSKKFWTYDSYREHLLNQNNIDDKDMDKLLDEGLLKTISTVSKDGFKAIGFGPLTKEEFNKSKFKIKLLPWLRK